MSKHIHGGDIYKDDYSGKKLLDFSANINPLGTPPAVIGALASSARLCAAYPDPYSRKLRAALGKCEGVPPEYIFCSNGAAEIIYRISQALRPKSALLPAPTFAEYEESLSLAGCAVAYHYLKESEGFRITSSFADAISGETDIVFLCNPNNPTGLSAPRSVLLEILEKCKATNTICALDECFIGFLEDQSSSMLDQIESSGNLIIIRAFTKIYAMAGIRLGYCICSNPGVIEKISLAGQPWSVSAIAQECGLAALSDKSYLEKTSALVRQQRERLISALRSMDIEVFDSHCNFILFRLPGTDLQYELSKHNILIRSCENFRGLGKGYYRIAVKSELDNRKLISALKEIL